MTTATAAETHSEYAAAALQFASMTPMTAFAGCFIPAYSSTGTGCGVATLDAGTTAVMTTANKFLTNLANMNRDIIMETLKACHWCLHPRCMMNDAAMQLHMVDLARLCPISQSQQNHSIASTFIKPELRNLRCDHGYGKII